MKKEWAIICLSMFILAACESTGINKENLVESPTEGESSKIKIDAEETKMPRPEMRKMMAGLWKTNDEYTFSITDQGRFTSPFVFTNVRIGPYDSSLSVADMGVYYPNSYNSETRTMDVVVEDEVFNKTTSRTLIFSENGKMVQETWTNEKGNHERTWTYEGEYDTLESYVQPLFPGYLATENIPELDLPLVEAYRTNNEIVGMAITEYHETEGIHVIGNSQLRRLIEAVDSGVFTIEEKMLWLRLANTINDIQKDNRGNSTVDVWLLVQTEDYDGFTPIMVISGGSGGEIFINQAKQ